MNGTCTVRHMARPRKKEPQTPFAERVFLAMEHAQLTQDDLAKLAGCSQATIGEIYKAQASKYTTQIAAACGVQAQWLATGDGPMLSEQQMLLPEVAEIAADINQLAPDQRHAVLMVIRNAMLLARQGNTQQENPVTHSDDRAGTSSQSGMRKVKGL